MTTYFDGTGREFTEATARKAVARARELEINEFVVSSNMGPSAWALIGELGGNGSGVTVVTHAAGFKKPFTREMDDNEREKLTDTGAKVITTSHLFGAIERGVGLKYQGGYPAMIMADTFRLFGQGVKVAVECAIMAADAGVLSGGKIVSIGGTGRGVDTALVLTPGHAAKVFEQVKIHEILCKPNLY